ncbi:amidohydrolase family protein [Streptomyces sp. H10-C2]|uniref:amidohydrolase family protein n=1 Tax=unclassified Streptomyces TaxID=2593676 RepID=UPI0024BA60E8|nr:MULTISPECIES: amidohydrolase family protein [unclassified Streptomyces]MDJ0345408.1 amidohydrolase family protein [Streptomyces sp. PH10-H1]MDJ0375198.1 amidohydrolase family protein [Streptomyces sp. H10-C2]
MNLRRDASSLIDALNNQSTDSDRRALITGATVVTMDPALGILAPADVLIEGDVIRAVAPDLLSQGAAENAVVIDASGFILSPGFVDTHRHAWEAQLRRLMPDVNDLGEYVLTTLAGLAPVYRPQDVYVGTRLAALTAIDSGITCMLDFSHNSRTPAHSVQAVQAVQALMDTGIRGVHASMGPHFGGWDRQWPGDLTRLHAQYFTGDHPLLSLRLAALATDEIAGPDLAYGPQLARAARELGFGVSIDAVFGATASTAIVHWAEEGLLTPQVTLIHCTGLAQQAWQAMANTGTTVSLAPTSEAQIGLDSAIPAIDEALSAGIRPGLGIDVEVALASDMFTQMRALHAIQRMRAVNAAYGTPDPGQPRRISTHDVLDFATLQGARTNGLGEVTGSLTPGKQADLLIIDAEDINTMPLNDAIGTVVLGSDPRNITAVFIAGQVRKWNGQVLGVDLPALAGRPPIHATTCSTPGPRTGTETLDGRASAVTNLQRSTTRPFITAARRTASCGPRCRHTGPP